MGLVSFLYSGVGGLAVGTVLAVLIGLIRKARNPDSSFVVAFIASVWLTVPISAFGIFMLFVAMWS